MKLIDLINKRFSVRNYIDKPVEREKIDLCIEAARLAPSACNSQPWKFIVVDDPILKNKITGNIFKGLYEMNSFAKQAPVLVIVISEKGRFTAKVAGFIRNTQYYLIDIGIAVEHFILQATELNLGTCWIGWFDEKKLKKILSIPKREKIDIVFTLGYSLETPPEIKRKPVEEMYYNKIS